MTKDTGLEKCVCYQGAYSLVMRDIEEDILPIIRHNKLGLVAYWNLAAGFLTGKYSPGSRVVPGSRSEEGWIFPYERFNARADEILQMLLQTSEDLGCEPAAAAIAWVKTHPEVTSNLIGARTLEQFEKNIQADGLTLPQESVDKLNQLSALSPRYPHWMEAQQKSRRDSAIKPTSG